MEETDRQTHTHTHTETYKQPDKWTYRQTERHTYTVTHIQTDIHVSYTTASATRASSPRMCNNLIV